MDRNRLAIDIAGCELTPMSENSLQKYKGDSPTSSFTFKIVLAMILVAIVPVGISLYVFHLIASFNQDLQQEAVVSIRGVSDVYKAWVKSESEHMQLASKTIELRVDSLLEKYQISRVRDVRLSDGFRAELSELFEQTVQEDDVVFDLRLSMNMEPLVHAHKQGIREEDYKFQVTEIPVAIRSRYQGLSEHIEQTEETEIPMLIAEPVDPDAEMDSSLALPEKLTGDPGMIVASPRGISLSMTFGLPKAQSELYEKIGERKYLHDSISMVEKDGGWSVTEIYQGIFITVSAIFLLITIIIAFVIAVPVSRRLSLLTASVKRVADGDLHAKVEVTGSDQISFLMQQFNSMVDDVRTAQESKAYIERMQAWREVARRLAHEIKNPLTPIVLAIQQLDKKFDDYVENPQKYRRLLNDVVEIVDEETETLRKLVKNFTEFARMPIPEMKESCFYDFVVQVVQQNPQFAESCKRIEVHRPQDDVSSQILSFDPELMRRVLINIIRNGIEAAQNAKFEPEIDISLKALDGEKKQLCLSIIDNGPGLTDEQKASLFMPYFTTKSDGTGLGLSIVRKIVEDHNGTITLHDRDDQARGTQADITLVC